ncbi:hypothetical protein C8R44DRAFT_863587 [Mycena epipterygia]|nr:hypothetical protein C8R44DRAFT_863587 [Mycena epipterygia]
MREQIFSSESSSSMASQLIPLSSNNGYVPMTTHLILRAAHCEAILSTSPLALERYDSEAEILRVKAVLKQLELDHAFSNVGTSAHWFDMILRSAPIQRFTA